MKRGKAIVVPYVAERTSAPLTDAASARIDAATIIGNLEQIQWMLKSLIEEIRLLKRKGCRRRQAK